MSFLLGFSEYVNIPISLSPYTSQFVLSFKADASS
jgi:hypothetical protein